MMTVIIARAEGMRTVADIEAETLLRYSQKAVGGLVDVVNVKSPSVGELSVWVNDEGLYDEEAVLNPFATALCAERGFAVPIVGDVVITGGVDAVGNTKGLTQRQEDLLMMAQVEKVRA